MLKRISLIAITTILYLLLFSLYSVFSVAREVGLAALLTPCSNQDNSFACALSPTLMPTSSHTPMSILTATKPTIESATPSPSMEKPTPTETPTPVPTDIPSLTPNLLIRTNTDPEPVEAGEVLTYTIAIANTGTGNATEVAIFSPLPNHTKFVPNSIELDPPSAGKVGTAPPTLAQDLIITPKQGITVSYAVTVTKPLTNGTIITNTISVTSTGVVTPTTSLITSTVTTTPRVEIFKSGPVTATVGTTTNYTFTVTNRGNTVLGIVQIDDDQIGQIYSINESGRNQLNLDETRAYTASYLIVTDTTPLVNTVTITARDALVPSRKVITATATHTTNLILPTPTFTLPPPTPTPTPVFILGLILRQTNEEVGTSKTLLLTSNNPITAPFYDYGCLAYGEAFAYSGNKIYHKFINDPDRQNSARKALADYLGLDNELALTFAKPDEIDDKIFRLILSDNLGQPPKSASNSIRGDFWIEVMPSENPPFIITVTISDTERVIGPVAFSFATTETNCSNDTSKGKRICYDPRTGELIPCPQE